MIPYSVLDLSPIPEGGTANEALANTLDLAQEAERLGYNRFWLAEHHNMTGIASAATAVVMDAVTELVERLRAEKAPVERWNPTKNHQKETGRFE